jgi:phosphoenolpyruvate carboxykinase (GTP)
MLLGAPKTVVCRRCLLAQPMLGVAIMTRSMVPSAIDAWVTEVARHTQPARIHWCTGSVHELAELRHAMVADGTLIPLSHPKYPASYLHRSDASDVARTEHLTFICTDAPHRVGPNNNWMSLKQAHGGVWPLFAQVMRDRTLYVVPYLMGPEGSPHSRVGVQITDSPYVVASLRIMTRMGDVAWRNLGSPDALVRGVHSLGDLSPDRRFIVHFPATRTIWSIGSGYGGNALLSKKCHALRIASVQGRDEGWLAEHMLIVGLTSPAGRTHYIAAAFPSACGKTNLAMMVPALPGWKVETIGDDIAWLHVGNDGQLWAINPEAGFFGVAPGTNRATNPNAVGALTHDVIFTNVALRNDGSPWWEGYSDLPANEVIEDWRGDKWRIGAKEPAAHPNARFTVALPQCPSVGHSFNDPRGVPISAIVFGGRRAHLTPLVYEATSWQHGVYIGATMVSETTAAATGEVGVPRHDPMAMLPFCGYNMAEYFAHWLNVGRRLSRPPKIFHVNWFRKGTDGRYLWPGYGNNIRVLAWMLARVEGHGKARLSPLGFMPTPDALSTDGLELSSTQLSELFAIEPDAWIEETQDVWSFLARFGATLPAAIHKEHGALVERLVAHREIATPAVGDEVLAC